MIQPRQPPPAAGRWTPSAQFLAQTNHLLAGALIVCAAGLAHLDPNKTLGWLVLAAAFKEFVLDSFVIERDTFGGDFADWTFYALGGLSGRLALMWLAASVIALSVVIVLLALNDAIQPHLPQADDYD